MTSAAEGRLERVLSRVGDLPAMPGTVAEVLRLADDPDADMNKIGDVLQRDPGLTAKILRVAMGLKQQRLPENFADQSQAQVRWHLQ